MNLSGVPGFVNASAGVGKDSKFAGGPVASGIPLVVGSVRPGIGPTSQSSSQGRVRSRMKRLTNAWCAFDKTG